MRNLKSVLGALVVGGATLLGGMRDAQAELIIRNPDEHTFRFNFEVHGIATYSFWGSFAPGVGVRFQIPIMRNGFIPRLNNSIQLGVGLDAVFYPFYRDAYNTFYGGLTVPVMLTWNFHLVPRFTLFGEVGLAPTLGFWNGYYDRCGAGNFFWCYLTPGFAVGGHLHFRQPAGYPALTFRVGFPVNLTVGVTF